jgi:predicted ArsR family transcriptional regulator
MSATGDASTRSVAPTNDFGHRVTMVAALAEPIRRELYRFVASQTDPVSRDSAAEGVGVARHVAKFHLEKLVDDGLLEFEFRRLSGRGGPGAGRPSKVYRRSQLEVTVSVPDRRYELAGQILAQALTDAEKLDIPVQLSLRIAARSAGRSLGKVGHVRNEETATQVEWRNATLEALEQGGYQPRTELGDILLSNCPFDSLARTYTDLACGMNLDLLEGLVASHAGAGFTAKLDPEEGRCCVRLCQTDTDAPHTDASRSAADLAT